MNDFPYRKGDNALILDKDNNFLIVQKKCYADNQWDFPGGGLNDGEDLREGILRYLGDKDDIKIQEDELKRIDWIPYEELKDRLIFEGQWKNAKADVEDAELF